jgi:aryl-alcohol dehydrogenase-like predicted oxidoreductase
LQSVDIVVYGDKKFTMETLMEKRILGATGIEVTLVGIGTLTMSPMQRGLSVEDGAAVILAALEGGISLIDTAQMYGSYEQVGAALLKWRGPKPVVASKSAARDYASMQAAVEECLEKTGLAAIDIFLLHAVRDADDFAGRAGALEYLRQARQKGLVKAIGASSHSALTIDFLAARDGVEVLHPMYNRDGIGILDAGLDEMTAILRRARSRGIGIYAMKPLGGGHLRNDAVAALRWLFSSDAVDAAVIGMTSIDEVKLNIDIAGGLQIDPDFACRVAGQPRRLFINAMICQNCGACIKACQQLALSAGEKSPQVDSGKCLLCGYCAPVCPKFAIRII